MNKKILILRYSCFAFLATLANIFTQRIIMSFKQTNLFFIFAILIGTIVGLIIKFFLDKKWIFFDNTSGIKLQSLKFGVYTSMSIISTLVFWVTEILFWVIGQTEHMREIGALIGLTFGYIIKYNLDRRFVFNKRQ